MSKARLVIIAVITEGRSQGEAARTYGVSQGWVSRLVARYRAEGEAAFEPRSRRPKTSPRAIGDATASLITELRKDLAGRDWTPGRTRSAGTWNTTTASGCHQRRSAATWPGPAW
jgi:transposase